MRSQLKCIGAADNFASTRHDLYTILALLHAAVAHAAWGTLFADGFESGSTGAWALAFP